MTSDQQIPTAVLRRDDESGPLPQMIAQRREQLRQEREAAPSSNLRVKLLKDVYDDGQDHHPPGYIARKGDVVVIHSIQTAVVSHTGSGHGFVVHDGELDLMQPDETTESPFPYPCDRVGWICSICHAWNLPKDKFCSHESRPATDSPVEPEAVRAGVSVKDPTPPQDIVLCAAMGPSGFICERPKGHPGRHCDGDNQRWAPEKPTQPLPDHLKAPVKAGDPCPAIDDAHTEHEGKCVYCGAPMAQADAAEPTRDNVATVRAFGTTIDPENGDERHDG